MIVLKDIGRFEELPERAMHIYKGDLPALHTAITAGWNIEEGIVLSKHTTISPLDLALISQQMEVVKLLVENGVNLNVHQKSGFFSGLFAIARRASSATLQRKVPRWTSTIVRDLALIHRPTMATKINIPLIHELGLDIKLHGGAVLRQAVSDHDYKTLTYLLDQGVNINYNKPDMVYPYGATPLTVAARMGVMSMVKFLVEHGADVTLAEKDGDRPYTIAVSNKHTELADYLKSLEPVDFHNAENKKQELKAYKLTDELVSFLLGDKLRLELAENEYGIGYIDFFTLTDTIQMKVGRQKLLRLSADIDNYSGLQLVWNPKKKGLIGCYDVEHKTYADLCSFAEFITQPELHLVRFLEGELS